MGKASRSKGRRGELEVQARLNEIGGDAVLLYGQAELGGQDGDVSSNYGLFEAKRRAAFPAWMDLRENVRAVYCRRDRGEWMVLLRAFDFEQLLMSQRKGASRTIPDAPEG